METVDFSNRRGALVGLLPHIYAILKDNAANDKSLRAKAPEHMVTWLQKAKRNLTDINRRFIVCMDAMVLAGYLFYRYKGKDIHIDDLQIAWNYRGDANILNGMLKKLEYDPGTKDAIFYAGEAIKVPKDTEILESVGFVHDFGSEGENLGSLGATVNALKSRYAL